MANSLIYRNINYGAGIQVPEGKGIFEVYTIKNVYTYSVITDNTAGEVQVSLQNGKQWENQSIKAAKSYKYNESTHKLDMVNPTIISCQSLSGYWVGTYYPTSMVSYDALYLARWSNTHYTDSGMQGVDYFDLSYTKRVYAKTTLDHQEAGTYEQTVIEDTTGRPETEGVYNKKWYKRVA